MKVKITKCDNKKWWYAKLIGKSIIVIPNHAKYYFVLTDEENKKYNTERGLIEGYICTIDKSDCEVLEQ